MPIPGFHVLISRLPSLWDVIVYNRGYLLLYTMVLGLMEECMIELHRLIIVYNKYLEGSE